MNFFNLHQHTTYSFLDGYGTPAQIADRLKTIDQDGCAITDHGNIYAHVPFSKVFKQEGLHLVYGCELYVVEKNESVRGYYHVTVLAKNNEGYQNLLKLVNLSNKQVYYKPRVTFQQLSECSKGLIILTGCFCDSWLIKYPLFEKQWFRWFKNAEWYVELQPFTDLQKEWDFITDFVKKKGLPAVITFDSHYPSPEDKTVHDFMLAINTNKPLSSPDRLKMDYPLYMPAIEAIIERCKAMGFYKEEWIALTHKIAHSCSVELPKTSMVKLDVSIEDIKKQCLLEMKKRGFSKNKEYKDRLDHELKLIKEKEFMDYFYIISDLMKWAKKRMLCGPARGSSAGSLVCYLLDITEVDPLKFGLLFERFIDTSRLDLPDIDIDFSAERREQVIGYLRSKYGQDKTAQLVTFNTFKPKAIIQDAARVLKIPQWEIKEATHQIIERSGGDSRVEFCLVDSIGQFEHLNKLFKKYPKLNDAIKLEGQVKQLGKHAAAVAITADPLETIGVINNNGIFSIDKHDAESMGLLKIDALGLQTLDILQDICDMVGFDSSKFYDLPLDDKLTFEKVFTPSKLVGIFQFEGFSVRKVCEDISPTTFDQLIHITALGRPGPLNSGSTKEYIKRFRGEKYEVDSILKPYTQETMGVIIFQEQVMSIVRFEADFSWEDSGLVGKAMSKRLGEEFLNRFRIQFVQGVTKKRGITEQHAIAAWNIIYKFGSWSFNKSHAASYAMLSFWIGYCKAHWPAQFYARILRDKMEPLDIIPALKEYGGKFIPLDLNKSKAYFSVDEDNKTLIGGFVNIKGIGEAAAQRIVKGQPYESLEDFKSRIPAGIASKVEDVMLNGQPWTDFTPMKERVDISKLSLSSPLMTLSDVAVKSVREAIVMGRVILVNLKDHNEEEKVQKRGFKMQGFTEYVVLKVEDDDFNIWHICFDKNYTARNKQLLLSTKNKICLFRINKLQEIMMGKKLHILEEIRA